MELDRIRIKNFRSIKDAEIKLDHKCLILLGKNEAGKSNILKAIAAAFGEYTVSNKDKRKKIDNEIIDSEDYFVYLIFKLNENDFEYILEQYSKKNPHKIIMFEDGKTIIDFIKFVFFEFLIAIKIEDNEKPIEGFWKYDSNKFKIGSIPNLPSLEKDKELNNLFSSLFEIVKNLYKSQEYKCLYWKYKEDYILPSSIDIDEFKQDSSSCKPLENIFTLCNRKNIKKEFEEAYSQDTDYSNLLEQVSNGVTKTFRKIWQDLKDTKIQLIPNGSEILIKIVDKTKYSFEDRSDGFKKFISILLMLSTQARSGKLNNRDLILIDEPDQSLYPSSARYLKDELLTISEKVNIIYCTHSQYMIDSKNLDRHLIIAKENDITTIKRQDRNAPFCDDELLRRAIGCSIFECLKDKNIIFEGWLDKELFRKYCESQKNEDFKNYGIVYLGGISGVETLVQLLILANKKFIIVADSDDASNKKKIEFDKNYSEYKDNWLQYASVVKNTSTMEDFLKTNYINDTIKKDYPDFDYNEKVNAIKNIENAVGKENKDLKQRIKNNLILSLTKDSIKDEYTNYIEALKEKISNV